MSAPTTPRKDGKSGYPEKNPRDDEEARQPAPEDAENPEEGGLDHDPDPET